MLEPSPGFNSAGSRPILVLGTDDIASAIGHALASAAVSTLLMRDPQVPVLRRGMSFDDALENGSVRLDGLVAYAEPASDDAMVCVTGRALRDLLDEERVGGVIDARMRLRGVKADLRGPFGFAVGLGPGFTAGVNVDHVIDVPQRPLRGLGFAPQAGLWWTFREIGERVEAGGVVGLCGGMQVPAPLTGALCGLVRRGTEVLAGTRLLEIDPRRLATPSHGIARDAAAIASTCLVAVRELLSIPRFAARSEPV
jgi:hypothetical protein